MREIDAIGITTKVIVVTQFDRFGESRRSVLREHLMDEMKNEFPNLFYGCVYYNGSDSEWRDEIESILKRI
jgi:hypothetical protein